MPSLEQYFELGRIAQPHLYLPVRFKDQTCGYIDAANIERLRPYSDSFIFRTGEVELRDRSDDYQERTRSLDDILRTIYDDDQTGFGEWCEEYTPVVPRFGAEPFFDLQRAAVRFLGVLTTGVHLNVYSQREGTGRLHLARRAAHISSYPGALDQAVAGFLPVGGDPRLKLLEEAREEAGLSAEAISKSVAVSSIEFALNGQPGLQRGAVYIFDVRITPDVKLRNNDGEVECFVEVEYKDVIQLLAEKQFKFDSGLVTLDFLMRHGALDYFDPDFLRIRGMLSGMTAFHAGLEKS